jgi:uncharacterized membrane protein
MKRAEHHDVMCCKNNTAKCSMSFSSQLTYLETIGLLAAVSVALNKDIGSFTHLEYIGLDIYFVIKWQAALLFSLASSLALCVLYFCQFAGVTHTHTSQNPKCVTISSSCCLVCIILPPLQSIGKIIDANICNMAILVYYNYN